MPKLGFQETGNGPVILLIHGFPMNRQVWEDFRFHLSKSFTVITIDLPGFGESPCLKAPFTLGDVGDVILEWLSEKKISRCIPIGHSLGGYITLAMVKKNPSNFSGFGLFHSTAFADSFEKKESRSKVMEFIERNGALAFTSNFIPPLFADQAHTGIEKVKSIAIQSNAETVLGYTRAMRDRPDQTDVFKNFRNPILFITGEKDIGIPAKSILQQASLNEKSETHLLENVAHMGMFENPGICGKIIYNFSKHCFV